MIIGPIITAGKLLFKYRKQIYAVVSAQDRYIKKAFVGTRVSKAGQYGWRSGAAAGSLLGTYIKLPDDQFNDAIQTPPKSPTSKPNKTRRRQTGKYNRRSRNQYEYRDNYRCPRPRRY